MTTFTQNWRIVFLTLLLGLIASATSMSVRADAVADYNGATLHCVTCHGTPPGTGMFKFTLAQLNTAFPTNTDLATYIQTSMPKDAIGQCNAACGQEMAQYLRPAANSPPVANASLSSHLSGAAPLTTTFDGSASTDDQGITSYSWIFGDGTTGSGKTTTHTYTAVGTYTATLKVTDAQGLQNSTNLTVTVATAHNPPVPNASKSYNLSGVAPLTAHFDASLSTCDGGCIYYEWDFDDGTNTQAITATHTFRVVGTHIVTLVVVDAGGFVAPGSTSTTTLTVTVSASSNPPVANANKSPNIKGAAPLKAQFDASLSSCDNSCSSYAWNFGDGSTASGVTTTHTYTAAGTYNVTLTVTDASNGKKSTYTLQAKVVPAESLATYVQACQSQLNFVNVPIPNLDCYDGDIFQTSADFDQNASVRDFMGYKKITDQVDVAFACRWLLGGDKTNRQKPISVEMLVNNHSTGNTCFFSAKGLLSTGDNQTPSPSSLITSPTDPAAASFWDTPGNVDATVRCINCHVSGPYIATPTIAPYLAKHGLMNNGHDTGSNITNADLTSSFNAAHVKYHAISATINGAPNAGAFSQWDSLKQIYMNPIDSGCAGSCHVVGTSSPQLQDIGQIQLGLTTILHDPANQLLEIDHAGVMPPFDDGSAYRWINLDTPGDGVETENFADAKNASATLVPTLLSNCAAPSVMEAHVVDTENEFVVAQPGRFAFLPDKLSVFNLKDGLVCLNSDQEPGTQCQDYRIHYECTDPTGKKTWTDWYNMDSPSGDGDHEERSKDANVCTSPAGSVATGIEAAVTLSVNGWTYSSIGPNDRLARMSQYGLTCNNADQPDGQCSNYVVRYTGCTTAPVTVNRTLTNVYATGKQLTATGTANNALTRGQGHNNSWNTQQWAIEPVLNTEYVRLRNTGTNTYLNVTTQAESAAVVTYALNTGYTSEEWTIEPVSGSTNFRLKNLWSGKYLTIQDPNTAGSGNQDYLALYSQTLNTGWTSQRWIIQ